MNRTIRFLDTTLRDGEQTPGVNLNLREKLEIAKNLEKTGLDIIEAGFASASAGDFEAVQAVAGEMARSTVASLTRCIKEDIDTSYKALASAAHPRIHIFIATSPLHIKYKFKSTEDDIADTIKRMVTYAAGTGMEIQFSCEDATRTPREFLRRAVLTALDSGASIINIADTVGYAVPYEFGELIADVRSWIGDGVQLGVHCHDDLGLAVANSISGMLRGANQIECTFNGIGDRSGNAAFEEIVMGLNVRKDFYNIDHNINAKRIYKTSRLISTLTGIPVPAVKSVTGINAFTHEAGIHQHAVLENRETYEIMLPEDIGRPSNTLTLGKLSGRHAFTERLKELGYELSAEETATAFAKFKDLADKKKIVTDDDIEALAKTYTVSVPELYEIKNFQVSIGNNIISTATVELLKNGVSIIEASTGDGPVDAIFRTIEKAVGTNFKLVDYSLKAVTEGKNALGEVKARISKFDSTYIGRGISTDIIEASAHAYVSAINRAAADLGDKMYTEPYQSHVPVFTSKKR